MAHGDALEKAYREGADPLATGTKNAEAVDIASQQVIKSSLARNAVGKLWRSVQNGAAVFPGSDINFFGKSGAPKVGQLHQISRPHENVVRLDVAM